jgi:hypothetical protein
MAGGMMLDETFRKQSPLRTPLGGKKCAASDLNPHRMLISTILRRLLSAPLFKRRLSLNKASGRWNGPVACSMASGQELVALLLPTDRKALGY